MAKAVPLTTGYSLKNKATLIRGGSEYFTLLEKLIDDATRQILFQVYIFDDDLTGQRIAAALSRAALRGLEVYVLLDGYASQHLSAEIQEKWKSSGVYFRWFEPLLRSRHFYFGRRLHHKVLVVDGFDGLVGGVNVSDKYNDMPDQDAWLDWAVHVQGEAVKDLHQICSSRAKHGWLSRGGTAIQWSVDAPTLPGKCHVRIRVNDWVRRKREISRSYMDMLRHAKTEVIMMSSYFMPGYDFRKQMRIALARGVKIKVILTGFSDVKLAKLAERYLYPWMLRNRFEIYEYQKSILHGKISVCDGEFVTIGSFNLNELSAKASVELNVDILEPSFGQIAKDKLEEIISSQCVRISSTKNLQAGPLDRVIQLLAFQSFRLILFLFTFYFKQRKTS